MANHGELPRFPTSTEGIVDSAYSILANEECTGRTFRKRVDALIPLEERDFHEDESIPAKDIQEVFSAAEYHLIHEEAMKALLERGFEPVTINGTIDPDAELNDLLKPIVMKYWENNVDVREYEQNIREYELHGEHDVRNWIAESIGETPDVVSFGDRIKIQSRVIAKYRENPSVSLKELTPDCAREYFKEKTISSFENMSLDVFRKKVADVEPKKGKPLSKADLEIMQAAVVSRLRESDFGKMSTVVQRAISTVYLGRMEAKEALGLSTNDV
ncbi:MAG: hypothetical protein WAN50_00680 [Minisyncoccia bacterium]